MIPMVLIAASDPRVPCIFMNKIYQRTEHSFASIASDTMLRTVWAIGDFDAATILPDINFKKMSSSSHTEAWRMA